MAQAGTLQAGEVRAMFDRIAGVYDPLNTAMTAGLHHRWRERAVDLAEVGPGARVLDVAAGTGDLTLALARRIAPGGAVIGSDFSEGMLDRAREKLERDRGEGEEDRGGGGYMSISALLSRARARQNARVHVPPDAGVRFEWGDALSLPYPDDTFDAVTVGFGARNFADLARGLGEMARVAKPGGRVVVLELSRPTRLPLSLFYGVWFDRLVPLLVGLGGPISRLVSGLRGDGGVEAGIADAYSYLPNSVKRWPNPMALAAELERAGLGEIRYLLLAGGIVAIHCGVVPLAPTSAPSRDV